MGPYVVRNVTYLIVTNVSKFVTTICQEWSMTIGYRP